MIGKNTRMSRRETQQTNNDEIHNTLIRGRLKSRRKSRWHHATASKAQPVA
jgi:hypothetical protein